MFFKGCSLSCRWCHNPEGIEREVEISFLPEKCVKCGYCFGVCRANAHRLEAAMARRFPGAVGSLLAKLAADPEINLYLSYANAVSAPVLSVEQRWSSNRSMAKMRLSRWRSSRARSRGIP